MSDSEDNNGSHNISILYKIPVYITVLVFGILITSPLSAEANKEVFIGFDLMHFDYREFDDNDILLDKETGFLPGLIAGWTHHWPEWYLGLNFDYHGGDVDYDGQTQSGVPLTTTTGTHISNLRIMGGRMFNGFAGAKSKLYGGAGYHYWWRDIYPSQDINGNPVSGLLEIYQWSFAFLGGELGLYNNNKTNLGLNVRAKYILQGTMDIDFQGYAGFDDASVNLGPDWSYRIGIPFSIVLNKQSNLLIEPYYDTWNIKQSNVTTLTVNGVAETLCRDSNGTPVVCRVLEPRSETRNFGISLVYNYWY